MKKKYRNLLIIISIVILIIIITIFSIDNDVKIEIKEDVKDINGNETYNMTSYNGNFISYGNWIIYSTGTNSLYAQSSLEGIYKYNKGTGQIIKLSDYNRILF